MVDIDPVLAEVLGPVREKIAELEAEIDQIELELAAKREELRPYRRVLNAADRNGNKPGRKPKAKSSEGYPISAEAIQRVEEFIREYFAERELTGTWLHKDWDLFAPGTRPSTATISAACAALHAGGVLRLVRRGTGGSKIYRLVG